MFKKLIISMSLLAAVGVFAVACASPTPTPTPDAMVAKGDTVPKSELDAANAELDAAKAEIVRLQAEVDAGDAMVDKGDTVPKSGLDAANAEIARLQAELDAGDAMVDKEKNTLDEVLARGELICGVKIDSPGYGFQLPDGTFQGNDIEYCRAVAAAIFGDENKVRFQEATGTNRFELLGNADIDVLIRTTTWTASRDANLNVDFVATTYYDGQGFMVKEAFANANNITSVNDLGGARTCVLQGTTTEEGLKIYFDANNIPYTASFFTTDQEALDAYRADQCDVLTSDKSQLAGWSFNTEQNTGVKSIILPETITKEPLGPSTRDNDSEFHDVVQWTVYGMIIAEEEGVNSSNVSAMAANPPNRNVANLLGVSESDIRIGHGKIKKTFMQDVLTQVGNYGEVFENTLGGIGVTRKGTFNELACPGGIDECSPTGGLIWAPPLR